MNFPTLPTDETKMNQRIFGENVHEMMNNVLWVTKKCINHCDSDEAIVKEGYLDSRPTRKCLDSCFAGYIKTNKMSAVLFEQISMIEDPEA